MPSFSSTLEKAIHHALALANERRHEFATLEHLLLSLLDEPDAKRVMQACSTTPCDAPKHLAPENRAVQLVVLIPEGHRRAESGVDRCWL